MRSSKTLYEGKAKKIIKGPKKNTLIQIFKDDATAYNKKKHKIFKGKGVLNNHISAHIMQYLKSKRIPTHFEEKLNDREQLIKKCEIIPIEFVVRNITAGSIAKKLGIKEGLKLKKPLLEYYYKEDSLDDPMISREHLITFGWATNSELKKIDNSWYVKIKIDSYYMKYIIQKGSITIDGVSLTINEVYTDEFSVMVIPHTYTNTIFKNYKVGSILNTEIDILAKYIEKLGNKE